MSESVFSDKIFALALLGSMATITADTLATEIGSLSKNSRLITNFKKVEPGTSGAISLLGEFVVIFASVFIGLIFYMLKIIEISVERALLLAVVSGFLGSHADSLIGATIQGVYVCRVCGREVEDKVHCGLRAQSRRGYSIVDNNVTNLISSFIGALIAVILYGVIEHAG